MITNFLTSGLACSKTCGRAKWVPGAAVDSQSRPQGLTSTLLSLLHYFTMALALLIPVKTWGIAVGVRNEGTLDYWETDTLYSVLGDNCLEPYAWTSQPTSLPPGQTHVFLGVVVCGDTDSIWIHYYNGSEWTGTDPVAVAYNTSFVGFKIYPYGKPIQDNEDRPWPERSHCGMPAWRVSEPYISQCFDDEPLGYQPAVGSRISLSLSYNHREERTGRDGATSSLGCRWSFSLLRRL